MAETEDRRETIVRAVQLLRAADRGTVSGWLAGISVHGDLEAGPGGLAGALEDSLGPAAAGAARFSAWKAARQVIAAVRGGCG